MQQHTRALDIRPEHIQAHMCKYKKSVNTNKHVRVRSILSPTSLIHLLQPKDRGISPKSPLYLSASASLTTPSSCPWCPPAFILHTPLSAHLAHSLSPLLPKTLTTTPTCLSLPCLTAPTASGSQRRPTDPVNPPTPLPKDLSFKPRLCDLLESHELTQDFSITRTHRHTDTHRF